MRFAGGVDQELIACALGHEAQPDHYAAHLDVDGDVHEVVVAQGNLELPDEDVCPLGAGVAAGR